MSDDASSIGQSAPPLLSHSRDNVDVLLSLGYRDWNEDFASHDMQTRSVERAECANQEALYPGHAYNARRNMEPSP
jgi:hypothetical protein